MPLLDPLEDCANYVDKYGDGVLDTSQMLCAGYPEGGTDTCQVVMLEVKKLSRRLGLLKQKSQPNNVSHVFSFVHQWLENCTFTIIDRT